MTTTDYQQQARDFLDRFGIKFRATLSDSKVAPWSGDTDLRVKGSPHHYRVTLSKGRPLYRIYEEIAEQPKPLYRLTFDFFGSIADAEKGEHPTAYDVLACISGDSYCADTFEDWCGEMGMETDSIKALQTYRRCSAFSKRLRAFFTAEEIEALQ